MKNSFILYTDYEKHINRLSDEQAGVLFRAILCFQAGKELPEMDAATGMAFSFISDDIAKNNEEYEKKIEAKKEAGKKGGMAKANKSKQKVAKGSSAKNAIAKDSTAKQSMANVADNDNVNDNVLKEKETNVSSKKVFTDESEKTEEKESDPIELIAPVVSIPLVGGKEWHCPMTLFNEFVDLYPGVDVAMQFKSMRGWCLANPTRWKTERGVKRFAAGWLEREQNRGRVSQIKRDPKFGIVRDTDYDSVVFDNMMSLGAGT